MKKVVFLVIFIVLAGSLVSCISSTISRITSAVSNEPWEQKATSSDNVVGTVEIEFESLNEDYDDFIHKKTKEMAYIKLLGEAKSKFTNNVDIRNLNVTILVKPKRNNPGVFAANGVVVDTTTKMQNIDNIEEGLTKAAEQLMNKLDKTSKIAIVYVSSNDENITEYIANELEFIMVNSGFTIIDRSNLDKIRQEQNFQLSGEVDDDTAVSIGRLVGANIIITGSVTGMESTRRLRLRALHTQTAQVMAVTSERI
jgi:curli biogenesis system outer membrane secretion channel CsgG